MTLKELHTSLEGKTKCHEIGAILNKATIATLKTYIQDEGIYHNGWSTWKKADFILLIQ